LYSFHNKSSSFVCNKNFMNKYEKSDEKRAFVYKATSKNLKKC